MYRPVDLHLRAERGDLFVQIVRESLSADLFDGRKIFEPGGGRDLSPEALSFQNEYFFSVPQSVECGGHARRTRADHDDVVHISRYSRYIF